MLIIVHHLITITKNLLILGEGPTYGINGGVRPPEKSLVLILPKQTQNLV